MLKLQPNADRARSFVGIRPDRCRKPNNSLWLQDGLSPQYLLHNNGAANIALALSFKRNIARLANIIANKKNR